ncbi:hypothetical protein HX001_00040 [Empedobacter brevis]|uniref:Uncharacterized protein n=1 Tax=Empedobacter brevis TaxID=247 RepID=A0AAJ1QAU8_9FLAO|nr:hypothetical protein [Empedobacter brevis]MDM1070874.1 hypothetical protein [Empedobacter brevis]
MKNNQKNIPDWVFWLLGLVILLLIISLSLPFFIYFKEFDQIKPIGNTENFGQYGDFIGGTTNFILGLASIISTVLLALIIKNLDDKNHNQSLDLQQKLFDRGLKENAYKEYTSIIQEFNKLERIDENYSNKLKEIIFKINSFNTTNSHIFNSIESHDLTNKFSKYIKIIIEYEEDAFNKKYNYKELIETYKPLNLLISDTKKYFLDEMK